MIGFCDALSCSNGNVEMPFHDLLELQCEHANVMLLADTLSSLQSDST